MFDPLKDIQKAVCIFEAIASGTEITADNSFFRDVEKIIRITDIQITFVLRIYRGQRIQWECSDIIPCDNLRLEIIIRVFAPERTFQGNHFQG